jgi:hypothetical protein
MIKLCTDMCSCAACAYSTLELYFLRLNPSFSNTVEQILPMCFCVNLGSFADAWTTSLYRILCSGGGLSQVWARISYTIDLMHLLSLQHIAYNNTNAEGTNNAHYATRNTQHATRNTQHATRNTQHATRNTQHATRNTQHATRNTQPSSMLTTQQALSCQENHTEW